MKTKYINVLFSFVIASFMMSCSSEIPTGDANKFSDMKSPEEDKREHKRYLQCSLLKEGLSLPC